MVVVDESTIIKNPKAERTKKVYELGEKAKYRRILTGSPIAKDPMDVFGQYTFLKPGILGTKSEHSFKHMYAVIQSLETKAGRRFEKIIRYQNLDELTEKMNKCSTRVLKDDCLDLPDKIYHRLSVEMTSEQKRAYNELKEFAMTTLDDTTVTAEEKIQQLIRMHQVTCGFINTEDGIKDIKNKRLPMLMEEVEKIDGKIIIFATYRHNIQQIMEALGKEYGKDSAVSYYGDTSQEKRVENIQRFQNDPRTRFFVTNRAGAYGITLTEASTTIYYANDYSLEVRLQSEDRNHRIGQTKSVNYIDMEVKGTVDEKIIKALREKKNIADMVTKDKGKDWI